MTAVYVPQNAADIGLGNFGAAGTSHSSGLVPDPGATPHSPAWLLGDDGAFHAPVAGSGAGTGAANTTYFGVPLTGSVNGTNTSFALPFTPVNGFAIYVDGVRWYQGTDFTYNSSTQAIVALIAAPQQWITVDGGGNQPYFSQAMSGAVDGSNTSFTLPRTPGNSFAISWDGARRYPGVDFTYNSATLIVTCGIAPTQWILADIY